MDTKLKNSRRIRMILAILAILVVTACNIYAFPKIGKNGEQAYSRRQTEQQIDQGFMDYLQMGSYVLYDETMGEGEKKDALVFQVLKDWRISFEEYRSLVDYYVQSGDQSTQNTAHSLSVLLEGKSADTEKVAQLQEMYQCYFTLDYDENGELSVKNVWSWNGQQDEIVKALLLAERQNTLESSFYPKNFRVLYAVPKDINMVAGAYWEDEYWGRVRAYYQSGGILLYVGSLAALALVMFLLTSNTIWRGTVNYKRRSIWYLMEASLIGVLLVILAHEPFVELNVQYVNRNETKTVLELFQYGQMGNVLNVVEMASVLVLIYGGWYLSLLFLRPLFALGPMEYLRQYSLFYHIFSRIIGWIRRFWKKTREEVDHIDFSDKTIKLIRKIVFFNFILLAVLSCFWFFGIIALIIYSVVLFYLIKKQYDKVKRDYQSLMQATARIAQGELEYEDGEDWGVFEPFKAELTKIRSGFSRAVEEEVRSQRMKTELITNVSHDLKTPLTAIATYVELLKEPNLTEEQRCAYVEVLERKSLRLKVLVEDLFEVSKASSNNIRLDLMEVDVVNLLKQVSVEHEDKFAEMGLGLRWKLPGEKITRMLDNQKTYRIFENLFINIEKYAMPGSRVYVEVSGKNQDSGQVKIIIRNMSAQEITVSGKEIAERFVRGDSARTTEGSGLGLAIARSFTEAQKGEFEVRVDGDLFKVCITF